MAKAKPTCTPQGLEHSREKLAEALLSLYQENNALERLPDQETLLKKLYASYEDMLSKIASGEAHNRTGRSLEEAFEERGSGELRLEGRIYSHPYARLEGTVESYFHNQKLADYFAQKEPEMLSRFHGYGLLGAYLISPVFMLYLYSSSPSATEKDIGKAILWHVVLFPVIMPLGLVAATGYAILPKFARKGVVNLIEKLEKRLEPEPLFDKEAHFAKIERETNSLLQHYQLEKGN